MNRIIRNPLALFALCIMAMLVAIGCAGRANDYARDRTFDAVSARLDQFVQQHPEQAEPVTAAVNAFTASTRDIASERQFKATVEPMLRQYAQENPASATSINAQLVSWERRLTRFETPPR